MLFPSEVFLFVFLPIVLAVYYVFLRRTKTLKNIFLLAASLLFYAWDEPKHVLLMIISILANYLFGILIDKTRNQRPLAQLMLAFMVFVNIGILSWFKYSTFAVLQINRFLHTELPVPVVALPIGISFFTFQAMSYVFDVYRGQGKVQKNPFQVGLYISLFPQLIAGPIVRYETIAEQIEHRTENLADFSAGVTRFCIGLGKKVLLANNMAIVVDNAFSLTIHGNFYSSVAMAWLGAVSYTLQIFFDFSGYSDMAIGLGQMFGFHFDENFKYPYIASTVSEFWQRWHISLQTWFRDYIYFPLGGSRVSRPRLILNLFIVWTLTGIWHGANWTFIAWGLFYFVLLAFEKLTGLNKKHYWWGHIYTMLFVILGWVIFRADNLGKAIPYIKAMFGIGTIGLVDSAVWAYLRQNGFYYLIALVSCLPFFPWLEKKLDRYKLWHVAYAIGVISIFIISVSFICNNSYNPFIYFNF